MMTELHWTPEQIGKLTLPHLIILTHKEPPDSGRRLKNAEDFNAYLREEARRERAWSE